MVKGMGKVGFVNVCDVDYVVPEVLAFADTAVANLENRGYEVVKMSRSITTEEEAQLYMRELLHQDVDCVIVFLGAWAQCPEAVAVVREIEHLPFCLWGLKMYEDADGRLESTCSYVSYAMIKGSLDRMGYSYGKVLGMPDDSATLDKVCVFLDAALAKQKLKRTRIGMVGGFSVGIWPATYDHVFLRKIIGPNVLPFDSYSVIRKIEAIKDEDAADMVAEVRASAKIHPDVSEEQVLKVAKMSMAIRQMCEEYSLHAFTIKCQYEFSKEYGMVMCVPLAMLAKTKVVTACESDIPCLVSMIMLQYLSGKTTAYGDVAHHIGNMIKFTPCGFAPFDMVEEEKRLIAPQTRFAGFKGINTRQVFMPGKITFMRMVEDCGTFHLVYGTGTGIETELRQTCMPALDVILDGSMERMIENFAGQHYAFCYGDYSNEVEALAKLLGIKTVRV